MESVLQVVHILASKGVKMIPFKLNYTVDSVQGILNFTMDVDMLAHFDEWQRSRHDDVYEAQEQWPTELRRARVIPAVDYVQAQRARGKLIREVKESFTVDAFIGNATDWERVCLGNLVGIPVIVVPTGFKRISNPPHSNHTRRRTTITTGIYAPPERDHIVSSNQLKSKNKMVKCALNYLITFFWSYAGSSTSYGFPIRHQSPQATASDR